MLKKKMPPKRRRTSTKRVSWEKPPKNTTTKRRKQSGSQTLNPSQQRQLKRFNKPQLLELGEITHANTQPSDTKEEIVEKISQTDLGKQIGVIGGSIIGMVGGLLKGGYEQYHNKHESEKSGKEKMTNVLKQGALGTFLGAATGSVMATTGAMIRSRAVIK